MQSPTLVKPQLPSWARVKSNGNHLDFTLTPKQLQERTKTLIEISKFIHDQVALVENPTFENTLLKLDDLDGFMSSFSSSLVFPRYISTDEEIRKVCSENSRLFSEHSTDMSMREDLYNVIKKVKVEESWTAEQKRYYEKVLLDFERSGLGIKDAAKRALLAKKQKEYQSMCIKFSQNLSEQKVRVELSKDQLVGLDDSFFEQLEKSSSDPSKYVINPDSYPQIFPIYERCTVAETRKKVLEARESMAPINVELFDKQLAIRNEICQLLGYKTWSDYRLDVNMAKNPETVWDFLNDLKGKLIEPGQQEKAKLLNLKKQYCEDNGIEFDGVLHLHDFRFFHQYLLRTQYNVDQKEIQEYFQLDFVLENLFETYSILFGVEFKLLQDQPAHLFWHKDVRLYGVFRDNSIIGHLYLDLFPRKGTYGHAACWPLTGAYKIPNNLYENLLDENPPKASERQRQMVVTAIVCNFTPPSEGIPSLLQFSEFVTLYHEIGHGIHNLLSDTTYHYFAGTSVETDFVEMPSQLLENWTWHHDIIKKNTKHYKTGQQLSNEKIKSLIESKNVNAGLMNLRQLLFGIFDMTCHNKYTPDLDVTQLYHSIRESVSLFSSNPTGHPQSSFGHLGTGGYSSLYYGYMWSLVYSADIFYSKFVPQGILKPTQVTKDYVAKILSRGGSRSGMEHLVDFLGRKPITDPFLVSIGLKKASETTSTSAETTS